MTDFGRASQTTGNQAIQEAWARTAHLEPSSEGGEWVPWRTVKIKPDILPRERQTPDQDVVERYALIASQLPPIVVQRGTFVLIDGFHRLHAAPESGSDFVRISELDIGDDELEERAFEENLAHGLPLCTKERSEAARRALKRHPDWSDVQIAKWAGVHVNTVAKHRRQRDGVEAAKQTRAASAENVQTTKEPQNVAPSESELPDPPRTSAQARASSAPASGGSPVTPVPKPSSSGRHAEQPLTGLAAFAAILERTPQSVADDVRDEELIDQIAYAERMVKWWTNYQVALGQRAGVPF